MKRDFRSTWGSLSQQGRGVWAGAFCPLSPRSLTMQKGLGGGGLCLPRDVFLSELPWVVDADRRTDTRRRRRWGNRPRGAMPCPEPAGHLPALPPNPAETKETGEDPTPNIHPHLTPPPPLQMPTDEFPPFQAFLCFWRPSEPVRASPLWESIWEHHLETLHGVKKTPKPMLLSSLEIAGFSSHSYVRMISIFN